jgi:hypothetical protein
MLVEGYRLIRRAGHSERERSIRRHILTYLGHKGRGSTLTQQGSFVSTASIARRDLQEYGVES